MGSSSSAYVRVRVTIERGQCCLNCMLKEEHRQYRRNMPPARTPKAQGRQKSCSECVKGKRKCDNGRPRCARCGRQGLSCTYSQTCKETPAVLAPEDISRQHNEPAGATTEFPDASVAVSPFDFEDLLGGTTFEGRIVDFDFSTSLNSLEHLTGVSNDSEIQDIAQGQYCSIKASSFSWTNIDALARTRIGYAIEQFKLAPNMIVDTCSTPWSHAMVYEDYMPRPLQDAQAACALYNAKNDTNAEAVIRHITSRVQELVTQPLPTAPIDLIAHAHALILYQIMFVFGGDIRLHGHGEAFLSHLEEAGHALLGLCIQDKEPTSFLPFYPSITARTAWRSFILRETLRRTVLSLYQFVALCHLLLGRQSSCASSLAQGNKVMLSAHLWRAQSAFDFAVAWNEKKHFLVQDLDLTEVWNDAQPDDIDDFAKALLVGLQGIDDVKGWLHTRGATF